MNRMTFVAGLLATRILFAAGNTDHAVVKSTSGVPLSFAQHGANSRKPGEWVARGNTYAISVNGTQVTIGLSSGQKAEQMSMRFVGAHEGGTVYGEELLPGKANYFIGADPTRWVRNEATYRTIRYNELYKGTDIIWYGNQGQLEYDLVLHPGADPNLLSIRLDGLQGISLDPSGDVTMQMASGRLKLLTPIIYQEVGDIRKRIAGHYELRNGREIGFRIENYDKSHALVIDPTLVYSGYYGAGNMNSRALAVDSAGNVYMGGYAPDNESRTRGGFALIAKFDPTGQKMLYSTYFGGTGSTQVNGIAVDSAGAAVVTGVANSPNFPLVNAAHSTPADQGNAFIAKLNAQGNQFVFSTYLASSSNAVGNAVTIDSHENTYVTGVSNADFSVTRGAYQGLRSTQSGAFVSKLTSSGTEIYTALLANGTSGSSGNSIAVDDRGAAYITGTAAPGTNFPSNPPGVDRRKDKARSGNIFIAKLDPDGADLNWAAFLGGSGQTVPVGLVMDTSGTLYIAGYTTAPDLPVGNAVQPSLLGETNVFAAELTADGSTFDRVTYLGGSKNDYATGLALTSTGLIITGYTSSPDFPSISPLQAVYPGTATLVYTSSDSGVTWIRTNSDTSPTKSYNAAAAPISAFSQLGGPATAAQNPSSSPLSPSTLYAADCTSVYQSTNAGKNWAVLNAAAGDAICHIAVAPSNPHTIYGSSATGDVFVSKDSGATWSLVSSALNGQSITSLSVNQANPAALSITVGSYAGFVAKINSNGLAWSTFYGSSGPGGIYRAAGAPQSDDVWITGPASLNLPMVQKVGDSSRVSENTGFLARISSASSATVSSSTSSLGEGASKPLSELGAAVPLASVQPLAQTTPTPLQFVPIAPCRIVDTRNNGGPITAQTFRSFTIAGTCAVPLNAAAFSLNVTVVPTGNISFVTVWPAGQPQPTASTLNSPDGRVKAVAAIVPGGSNGAVSVFNNTGSTNIILDINGYFVAAGSSGGLDFYPISPPCRIADTRQAAGPLGGPSLAALAVRDFPVLQSGCNIPQSAQAYSLNFTVVPPAPLGYITVYPAGKPLPTVSTLNDKTGQVLANAAIVPGGTNGDIDVFATNNTHLVIDINGYYASHTATGLDFYPISPCRVIDTRQLGPPFSGDKVVNVSGSGCTLPLNVTPHAFAFNATAIPTKASGYVTLWAGGTQPAVSNMNAGDGSVVNNMAAVPTNNGQIAAFTATPMQLVLDLLGVFGTVPAPPPTGNITVNSVTVGQNLEVPINITLSQPAPVGGVTVTIASSNASLALVGDSALAGRASIAPLIAAGTTTFSTYVQALAGSGTATITISAPNYKSATSTVTFAPSGFVVAGPNGIGGAFNIFEGATTPLTVSAGYLNASNVLVASQLLRGGLVVSVPVSSSNTAVGNVSAASVGINGGANSGTVNFKASASTTGKTNVTLGTVTGFKTASTGNTVAVTVQQTGIVPFTATVGQNLEQGVSLTLQSPASSPVTLTVQSSDASKLKFSTNPTNVGTASITLTIPPGQSHSPNFYAQAFGSTGSVGYTASATGYGSTTGTVTLAPSGLAIQSPGGFGAPSFTVPVSAGSVDIQVYTGYLSGGAFAEAQFVAGGQAVSVTVASGTPSVGTITMSPIAIGGGTDTASTNLTLLAAGSTTVTASSPGFTSASVAGTISNVQQVLAISGGDAIVGKNLESQFTVSLPQPAGASGVTITVQSSTPALLLAAAANAAGASAINLTVPPSQLSAIFFAQGVSDTGGATITASSAGLTSATKTVALSPSAIIIAPSMLSGSAGGNVTAELLTALLDATNTPTPSDEGPYQPIAVPLTSSNTGIATVPVSATISPGSTTVLFPISLVGDGTATVSVIQPPGFGTPNKFTTTAVTSNP